MCPAINVLQQSTVVDDTTKATLIQDLEDNTLRMLGDAASKIPAGETGITALDWVNGRRTPDADQTLSMAIAGLKMGSQAPHAYPDVASAQKVMASPVCKTYQPDAATAKVYERLYQKYQQLGAFVSGNALGGSL